MLHLSRSHLRFWSRDSSIWPYRPDFRELLIDLEGGQGGQGGQGGDLGVVQGDGAEATAFPDEGYVSRLGRLAYAVGSLEWSILGHLPGLAGVLPEGVWLENLADETTGIIGKRLVEATV